MKKIVALMLLFAMCLTMIPSDVFARTITEGNSKWVNITVGSTRQNYLSTTTGTALGGNSWHYRTDDGIEGGAFCLDWFRP